MKKITILITSLLFVSLIFSGEKAEKKVYTSKILKMDSEGNTLERVFYKNKTKIATLYYNEKGILLKAVGRVPDDIVICSYFENGSLKDERRYSMNKMDGINKYYYENGSIKSIVSYKADKLNGSLKGYYENGNLKDDLKFKNDLIDGIAKTYYSNGKKKSIEIFKAGKPNGLFKYYYENGNLSEVSKHVNGELNGEFKTYYEDGSPKVMCIYKDGILVGKYVEYYENKQIKFDNKLVGKKSFGKYFEEDGKLIYDTKEKIIKVSAEKLAKDYDDNEIVANDKYYGQYIKLSGVVVEIKESSNGKKYYLEIDNEVGKTIKCYFSEKKSLLSLKKGQKITIVGFMNGKDTWGDLFIVSCEIQ